MMHYIRHALPHDKPHIGFDVEDWAVPDGSRLLRSEITCAVSLMMERMIRPEFLEHKICPVCSTNLLTLNAVGHFHSAQLNVSFFFPCTVSLHISRHARSYSREHMDNFL